jgi:hypothetical protein
MSISTLIFHMQLKTGLAHGLLNLNYFELSSQVMFQFK